MFVCLLAFSSHTQGLSDGAMLQDACFAEGHVGFIVAQASKVGGSACCYGESCCNAGCLERHVISWIVIASLWDAMDAYST